MSTLWHRLTLPFRRYPMLAGILLPLIVVATLFLAPRLMSPSSPPLDAMGRTPLTLAAERGELETVMAMLDDGAALDGRDGCGWTALMKAAAGGHLAMLEALLARGADIEHRDDSGYTPLMVAVVNGQEATSRALLDAGASVDAADNEVAWSSLIWAARGGRVALVDLLLDHGANPTYSAQDGTTAVYWAQDGGHDDVAARLGLAIAERQAALSQ